MKHKLANGDELEPSKVEATLVSQLKAAIASLDSKQPESVIGTGRRWIALDFALINLSYNSASRRP